MTTSSNSDTQKPPTQSEHATELLRLSRSGNREAADELLPLLYDELRRIAANILGSYSGESAKAAGVTLSGTVLVHEAYLKLICESERTTRDREHFFALCATAIRHVLVDHLRSRSARKRGGDWTRKELDSSWMDGQTSDFDLLELHDAMEALIREHPRAGKVMDLRLFAELKVAAIAEMLGISERSVESDSALGRAWLLRELQ